MSFKYPPGTERRVKAQPVNLCCCRECRACPPAAAHAPPKCPKVGLLEPPSRAKHPSLPAPRAPSQGRAAAHPLLSARAVMMCPAPGSGCARLGVCPARPSGRCCRHLLARGRGAAAAHPAAPTKHLPSILCGAVGRCNCDLALISHPLNVLKMMAEGSRVDLIVLSKLSIRICFLQKSLSGRNSPWPGFSMRAGQEKGERRARQRK